MQITITLTPDDTVIITTAAASLGLPRTVEEWCRDRLTEAIAVATAQQEQVAVTEIGAKFAKADPVAKDAVRAALAGVRLSTDPVKE